MLCITSWSMIVQCLFKYVWKVPAFIRDDKAGRINNSTSETMVNKGWIVYSRSEMTVHVSRDFVHKWTMDQEIDKWIGAVSAAMQSLSLTVVVKREAKQDAEALCLPLRLCSNLYLWPWHGGALMSQHSPGNWHTSWRGHFFADAVTPLSTIWISRTWTFHKI